MLCCPNTKERNIEETVLYHSEDLDEEDEYSVIDDGLGTDAENVIADYDDYPQYDYDGEYEEGITGPGGPDYGQYYDYDYDSRNQNPIGSDFNEGSGSTDTEESKEPDIDDNTALEYEIDDVKEEVPIYTSNESTERIEDTPEFSTEVTPTTTMSTESSRIPTTSPTTTSSLASFYIITDINLFFNL